jgi:hypothetical protein
MVHGYAYLSGLAAGRTTFDSHNVTVTDNVKLRFIKSKSKLSAYLNFYHWYSSVNHYYYHLRYIS